MSRRYGETLRVVTTAVLFVTFGAIAGSPTPAIASGTATIVGTVTYSDTGLPAGIGEVSVSAFGSGSTTPRASTTTDGNGAYVLTVPAAQSFDVKFDFLESGRYADEWTNSAPAPQYANDVWVPAGGTVVHNAELAPGSGLSGQLSLPDGSPAVGALVTIERYYTYQSYPYHEVTYSTSVDPTGAWRFSGLPAAAYRVQLVYQTIDAYHSTWWQEDYDKALGEEVALGEGQEITDMDVEFFDNTSLSVLFTCSICDSDALRSVGVQYEVEFRADENQPWRHVTTEYSFDFHRAMARIKVRAPGQYRVLGSFASEADWGYGYSRIVSVAEGDEATLSASRMSRPPVNRLSGANRFATTARVVATSHPAGADVVYVANGTTFADALSAGPAATAEGAPLLLVTTTGVPPETFAELRRLDPSKIVIVGGEGAVSATVAAQLESVAPVQRRSGADRYATSREVAQRAFPQGSEIVYVATGASFPDALSAGAVAGALGTPLVTLNGAASSIDSATRQLLVDLGAREIRVVGGPGAVSAGVASSLESVPGVERVERYSGADRYATALAVSTVLTDPTFVFLAVGTSFADALGGGPLAGTTGSPLIVIPRSCVPLAVIEHIRQTAPDEVLLLGGTGALEATVESLNPCG